MSSSWIKHRISARYLAPAVLALVLTGAVACSAILDDAGGFFEDDEVNDRALSQDGGDQDFPKLSEVPDTPRPASSPEDLDQLSEGLVADRDEARYTNETLRSRYADDGPDVDEPQVASVATAVEPVRQPDPLPIPETDPGEFIERQPVSDIEPASESVFRERQAAEQNVAVTATSSESTVRQIEPVQAARRVDASETRVAKVTESGVMAINQFRALFNERFDSSGSSPYRQANVQQVSAQVRQGSLLSDRPLSSDGADNMPASLSSETPFSDQIAGTSAGSISFQAASIPFSTGSTALNSADRAALKQVVKLHQKFGGHVRVIGHSSQRTRDMDSDSHRLVNFQISLDRATAVSMELTRLGVPTEAVMVDARSDNEPLSYEYMPAGEAENRRADIYIEF
ncbi:MAG: OmpA family protein [Proteobacteria bacterium]|nr:OmpA family protein [Pseudomonadota bacterium]MDA1355002.1 OmpA family protein [Pseudomonadota bacterium]